MKRFYLSANEFVKKVGINAAKAQLGLVFELHPKHKFDLHDVEMFGCNVDVLELKQFVDSYELIDSYGGFHSAINTLKLLESSLQIGLDHGLQVDAVTEIPKLKQAIADMGSVGKSA